MAGEKEREEEREREEHVFQALRQDVKKRQSYFCSQCDFPSDTFGLLNPCSHVYCLTCASQMSDCVICKERVDGVRAVKDVGELWVSPLTLRGGIGKTGREELARELR